MSRVWRLACSMGAATAVGFSITKCTPNLEGTNHPLGRVVTYGGSGFVGSKIVEKLARHGFQVTSVSRTGACPMHLESEQSSEWMANVDWVSGDALEPDAKCMQGADAVITLVGLPPLPNLSEESFNQAVAINGTANARVIKTAQDAGVQNVLLVSAHVPWLIQSEKFGYWVGKKIGLTAAKEFSEKTGSTAIVLKPSAIYGTRHTKGGTPIPLGWVMGPVAFIHNHLPSFVAQFLPHPFTSVDQVAQAALDTVSSSISTSASASASASKLESESAAAVKSFVVVEADELAQWQESSD